MKADASLPDWRIFASTMRYSDADRRVESFSVLAFGLGGRQDFCSERLKGLLQVIIGHLLMAPVYSMAEVLRTLKSQHLRSKRVVLPLEEHERHSR